jgi:hypothetical protein
MLLKKLQRENHYLLHPMNKKITSSGYIFPWITELANQILGGMN